MKVPTENPAEMGSKNYFSKPDPGFTNITTISNHANGMCPCSSGTMIGNSDLYRSSSGHGVHGIKDKKRPHLG